MTPEQQKDADRLERYILREGLAPVMNDTKWREVIQLLLDVMGHRVRFRVKDVRGPEPRIDFWDDSFPYHVPHLFKTIEWLEVNPVIEDSSEVPSSSEVQDFTGAIMNAFRAKGIPYSLEHNILRIQGYTRTSQKGASFVWQP